MKLIIPLIAAFSLAPVVLIAAELGDTSKASQASATDEITDEGGRDEEDEEDEEERRQRLNLELGAE